MCVCVSVCFYLNVAIARGFVCVCVRVCVFPSVFPSVLALCVSLCGSVVTS